MNFNHIITALTIYPDVDDFLNQCFKNFESTFFFFFNLTFVTSQKNAIGFVQIEMQNRIMNQSCEVEHREMKMWFYICLSIRVFHEMKIKMSITKLCVINFQ